MIKKHIKTDEKFQKNSNDFHDFRFLDIFVKYLGIFWGFRGKFHGKFRGKFRDFQESIWEFQGFFKDSAFKAFEILHKIAKNSLVILAQIFLASFHKNDEY